MRIITRIDKCKSKLQEVVENGRIFQELKSDLVGRLKGFVKILSDVEINLIKDFATKYANSVCDHIDKRFLESTCKILESYSIFHLELFPTSSKFITFNLYGIEKQFFPSTLVFKFEMVKIQSAL